MPEPLGRETSLSIFRRMLLMRHFEEAVIRLHNEGRFVSHYHVYIGQEATGARLRRPCSASTCDIRSREPSLHSASSGRLPAAVARKGE